MARTFATLKSLVSSKLGRATGTLTDSDFQNGFNLALDDLKLKVDFAEAMKTAVLTPALFKDVTYYAVPTDLDGAEIMDLRPINDFPTSTVNQEWQKTTSVEFTRNLLTSRGQPRLSIEYDNGDKYLRVLKDTDAPAQNVQIDACDTYNGDGTWTADTANSDATNVTTNAVSFFAGSGSVSFDIDVSQTVSNFARIYNATGTSVDLSDFSTPYIFFYVYIPNVTDVTSVTIVIGSDSGATPTTKANYLSFTTTTQFDGSALQTGKNLLGVARSSATAVGTIDLSNILYKEFTITYGATQGDMTGVLLDSIWYRDGQFYEVRYMTDNLVVSAAGTHKEYFTADDDTFLANADGEVLLVNYVAGYLAPNVEDATMGDRLMASAVRSITDYKVKYPSERRMTKRNWYYNGNAKNDSQSDMVRNRF